MKTKQRARVFAQIRELSELRGKQGKKQLFTILKRLFSIKEKFDFQSLTELNDSQVDRFEQMIKDSLILAQFSDF